jgi:hypothetical protein
MADDRNGGLSRYGDAYGYSDAYGDLSPGMVRFRAYIRSHGDTYALTADPA